MRVSLRVSEAQQQRSAEQPAQPSASASMDLCRHGRDTHHCSHAALAQVHWLGYGLGSLCSALLSSVCAALLILLSSALHCNWPSTTVHRPFPSSSLLQPSSISSHSCSAQLSRTATAQPILPSPHPTPFPSPPPLPLPLTVWMRAGVGGGAAHAAVGREDAKERSGCGAHEGTLLAALLANIVANIVADNVTAPLPIGFPAAKINPNACVKN